LGGVAVKLEIVTHCYCPPGVTQYAKMLEWQIASLQKHAVGFSQVDLYVCCTTSDLATCRGLEFAWEHHGLADYLQVYGEFMPPEQLFRRAIGRNQRALTTTADIVWFTDVDYFVGPGFLQAVSDCPFLTPSSGLTYPNKININIKHELGDKMLLDVEPGAIDDSLFASKRLRKAIGGVQFVGGDVARKYGYLKQRDKWQTPVDASKGFRQCRCDVPYRMGMAKEFGGVPRFEAEGLYRIRHTTAGRDYDVNGVQGTGKENWR
jgi:hypothetical protein